MLLTTEIVIPVHNTLNLTKKCLPALKTAIGEVNAKHLVEYSITVIDDGSTDETTKWIKENHPSITLIKGDGSLWWSGAITKAAYKAFKINQKDYILLWNNDIVPDKEYFYRLNNIINTIDAETIVGSKICNLNNPEQIWSLGGVFNPRNGNKYMLGHDKNVTVNGNQPIEADWLTGMGTLIPKKATEKIGYWNSKDFPLYHGDSDFTYRAKKAGFKLLVYPELILYNDTSNTGFMHEGSLSKLINSFTAIRSKYNIKKEWRFYRLHALSWWAYSRILYKYFKYTAGFFKWKILNFFRIKKVSI
jgi:GT2 family glycosyltransferase